MGRTAKYTPAERIKVRAASSAKQYKRFQDAVRAIQDFYPVLETLAKTTPELFAALNDEQRQLLNKVRTTYLEVKQYGKQ